MLRQCAPTVHETFSKFFRVPTLFKVGCSGNSRLIYKLQRRGETNFVLHGCCLSITPFLWNRISEQDDFCFAKYPFIDELDALSSAGNEVASRALT